MYRNYNLRIMNKNKVLFILFVLLTSDILLLFQNFEKQNSINELNRQLQILEKLNPTNEMGLNIDYKLLDSIDMEIKPNRLLLISLLTEQGCGSCLEEEIEYLNTIYSKYKDYLLVFYEGNPSVLKSFNAKFKFQNTNNLKKKFNLPIRVDNPVSILVDKYGNIQSYHKAVVSDPSASASFYFKVNSLFKSVYEK